MAIHSIDFPSLVNLEVIHGAYGRMKSGNHHPIPLHFLLRSQKKKKLNLFLNISPVFMSCDITSGRPRHSWLHGSALLLVRRQVCNNSANILPPTPLETASCHGDWLSEASILHPPLAPFKQPPEDGYTPQIMISPHQLCYTLLSPMV